MCFRNCWYAAIFESHANNPKLKTGETVSPKPEMLKPGNRENRKCGNPDHPEIGKSDINQKPKAIPTIRDSCIRLGLLFDVETRKR